ncbi:L-cysteine:1D-myo-inositol 2-amino-2-deoxy-alpha-D-glucopyranoside ligase [Dissostichus eleginoides]|uniref:L-cysteine:1D-myo-inositol 2-amino-2-deoxy-alpha-D-glucopyranoside ligase n=1 Tax=Dissostichus eleginoides TaxID=100907 RepID=A0AAD9CIB6_DISEL|nr:L-cysteine:1D-myo-inositol 2-amino-2-deoxy-alpha-D-glucopyranoside ligase [Dissostichus eleginoides]
MENEAEHFNVSEKDSTSRTSSNKSEKTASSTSSPSSVTSEVASTIVSEILERSTGNLCELLQSISRWEANDDGDKSSAARRVNQNIEHELDRFFGLRRLFAEYQGETLEDTDKDIVPEMDSAPGPSGQEGHETTTIRTQTSHDSDRTDEKPTVSKIYKKVKSALKHCFKLEHKTADQNYGFPCPEEAFPSADTPPSEDIRDATHEDLSSVPLQLVDHVNTSSHTDEIVGLDSSESTSKENIQKKVFFQEMDEPSQNKDVCHTAMSVSAEKLSDSDVTDVKSASRFESNIYKKMKTSLKSCLESKSKKVQFATEKDLDEAVESGSTCPKETSPTASNEDIKAAEKRDLNSVPLEINNNVGHEEVPPENKEVPLTFSPTGSSQPAEHDEVSFDVMDEDLVTITESTPGPSGQDLEPPRDHLAAEQSLEEIIETASSNLTSSSESPEEISITFSTGSSEDIRDETHEDLSSVPLQLVDHVEHENSIVQKTLNSSHTDEIVGLDSSDSTSEENIQKRVCFQEMDEPSENKDFCQTALTVSAQEFCKSDWTDVKCASRCESNIYKKMKYSLKSCLESKLKKVQFATEKDLDEAVESGSTDLVTNTESTPGPSGQDLEPPQGHLAAEQSVDDIFQTAISNLMSSSESPEEIYISFSTGSSEDLKFAEEVNLSSVPMT